MPRHVAAKHGPHPTDVHVGNRVRLRRTLLGMSQSALGEALGQSSQLVHKYERGAIRISASAPCAFKKMPHVGRSEYQARQQESGK